MSMKSLIFQIYYDEKTKSENDTGFLQLDNSSNLRPDWSEYWPIRHFLSSNKLEDDCYYGFFSPKFRQKTGLSSTDVMQFIEVCDHDIVAFSPYFDQSAYSTNIFNQASDQHPGISRAIEESFALIDPSCNLSDIVTHSQNTIFCNYFVAKRAFWEAWFACCEKIYEACENSSSELAGMLNGDVSHSNTPYPSKVFIIERVATFLLSRNPSAWKVKVYNPILLPYSQAPIANLPAELIQLDALKIAYCQTGFADYMDCFHDLCSNLGPLLISRQTALTSANLTDKPIKQHSLLSKLFRGKK